MRCVAVQRGASRCRRAPTRGSRAPPERKEDGDEDEVEQGDWPRVVFDTRYQVYARDEVYSPWLNPNTSDARSAHAFLKLKKRDVIEALNVKERERGRERGEFFSSRGECETGSCFV